MCTFWVSALRSPSSTRPVSSPGSSCWNAIANNSCHFLEGCSRTHSNLNYIYDGQCVWTCWLFWDDGVKEVTGKYGWTRICVRVCATRSLGRGGAMAKGNHIPKGVTNPGICFGHPEPLLLLFPVTESHPGTTILFGLDHRLSIYGRLREWSIISIPQRSKMRYQIIQRQRK